MKQKEHILALDVSTTTIGVAVFENLGEYGELKLLHHISPKVKPKPNFKIEELIIKADIFNDTFLKKNKHFNITKVIIEEPLLRSNNVYTVSTLLRFNTLVSDRVYNELGVVSDFISSYDARKYAYPELVQKRVKNKKGEVLPKKQMEKSTPVLFGAYDFDVDKKEIILDKVSDLEPQIVWLFDKNNKFKKENYDMTDAYTAGLGFMRMNNIWK